MKINHSNITNTNRSSAAAKYCFEPSIIVLITEQASIRTVCMGSHAIIVNNEGEEVSEGSV